MFFCVISIVVGGYLVSLKLRAIYNRLPLSLKDKISFGEGLILIISGFIALYGNAAFTDSEEEADSLIFDIPFQMKGVSNPALVFREIITPLSVFQPHVVNGCTDYESSSYSK